MLGFRGFSRYGDVSAGEAGQVNGKADAAYGEEDAKIVQLVSQLGAKRWSMIARELPGRIGKQCRERYRLCLFSPVVDIKALYALPCPHPVM